MAKNPRDPKAVKKLIADAQQRKIDKGVVAFVKRIIKSDQDRRDSSGGGTRKTPRDS
jgi:hypothetical protein